MRGLMMDRPLLIGALIRYAAEYHGDTEIVTRTTEGPIHRYNYVEAERRAKQLAKAMMRLGVAVGDRVATIAWNNHRHFELYFAVSGIGAVCHTINPRLFPDQLRYIVNHAEDKLLFLDLTFVPIAEKMAAEWPGVQHYVIMTDRAHMPQTSLQGALCYEDLIEAETATLDWPRIRREHRVLALLHLGYDRQSQGRALLPPLDGAALLRRLLGRCDGDLDARFDLAGRADVPCQRLGHPLCRGDGRREAGLSRAEARRRESPRAVRRPRGVTLSLGVPTVWLGLLQYLEQSGKRLDGVKRVTVGGSAVPRAMIEAFEVKYGVEVRPWLGHDGNEPGGVARAAQGEASPPPPRRSRSPSRRSRAFRSSAST